MVLERLLDATNPTGSPAELYESIRFPDPPEHRPYVYINMAATVDGKIVVGEVGGTAAGVGGATDQQLFRRLQRNCDAVMIGSSTLRASHVIYPADIPRYVVTRSGEIPLQNRFFTDAPDRAFILAPEDLPAAVLTKLSASAHVIQIGKSDVDLAGALSLLRRSTGIMKLLCEGGPTLNEQFLQAGLADELFLTISAKLKGGAQIPTIVEGRGFPVSQALPLTLLSVYREGDELYLRYQIGREVCKYGRIQPD